MTTLHSPNRLECQLERLDEVPAFARTWFRSVVLRRALPFVRTAGLRFIEMSQQRTEVGIRSRHKVHDQTGSVHASAINLLAETASGMAVGMNLRDDCLPLLREVKMTFKSRAAGSLRAVAALSDAQRAAMRAGDHGEITVPVSVTDEAGDHPVECEFIWSWMPAGVRKS
jgi:acyl-coenzyme A thioesterase PaaI-like protein